MTKSEIIKNEFFKNPEFNRRKLAKKLDVRESYIRKVIRPLRKEIVDQGYEAPKEKIEFNNTSKNHAKLDLESLTITTLEQAIEVAQVDMTQWKVDRYTIGSWQVTLKVKTDTGRFDNKGQTIMVDTPKTVTMYKIQVWLKKLHNMEWVEAIRNLIQEIPKMTVPERKFELDGQYLLEIALVDSHFGLLSWREETNYDYDLKIAEDLYLFGIQDLLSKAQGYNISKIIFPIGSDFMHVNDHTNLTPASKNILDTDSRLIKIYQKAKMAVIKGIEYCRNIAPVEVIYVPGNHDFTISYAIADVVDAVFQNDSYVTVNKTPKSRKFTEWGKCMIAFTHGNEEPIRDLPTIIATEEPEMWGRTLFREVHLGHYHSKKSIHWMGVDTNRGIITRILPSLCPPDQWHYKKGYIRSFHACSSFIFDSNRGLVAEYTSYGDEILDRARNS